MGNDFIVYNILTASAFVTFELAKKTGEIAIVRLLGSNC